MSERVRDAIFPLAVLIFLAHPGCAPVSPDDGAATAARSDEPAESVYTHRDPTRDGTGKVYMGREIAHFMTHEGAAWLDRPGRDREEHTTRLIEMLQLERDEEVVDLGAGTGYFSVRMSPLVPDGTVYAVEIQQEMLDIIDRRVAEEGVGNVRTVLGTITDPKLPPNGVDVVLIVDAYHEFSHPREMMAGVKRALRPGGRVVLVEFRAEDPRVPIKPLHKMTEAQARKEMEAIGLVWVETRNDLPRQHFMVFEKR